MGEPDPEQVRRFFSEWAAEQFGPNWSAIPEDELKRALREDTNYMAGSVAQAEQEAKFNREVAEFGVELVRRLEPYGPHVPGEAFAPTLVALVEERYGGWTTLAVNVCATLGFEVSGYTARPDSVF